MTETPAATPPGAIRYRAFLSYAHADTAWAKWLHAALEGFRIDNDLAGRTTPLGPVPKTLRPIFRDREDFSGGHTLTDATIAALDASSALIVLCSPVAATRPAVNEEVRLFRSRHPDRPVIPVIVEGTYPENFPPALRYELAPDGSVTDQPITILGPDLRESGDGKSLSLAKVVAGLIGVPSDDIFRRAERAKQRQARLRNGVAGVIVALMASGGFFAWRSYQTQQTLAERQSTIAEIEALVAKYGPVGAAQAAPGAGSSLAAAITAIANGAASDVRYAKALELLKVGKPAEAEPLLKEVADEMAARATTHAKQAAEAYRNLGVIAGLADPKRAREYLSRALEFDPDNVGALLWGGWLELAGGDHAAAERMYRRLLALKGDAADGREIVWVRLGLGDILTARGDLAAAKSEYLQAQAIAAQLTERAPNNATWQRDLSVAHERVGNVLVAQGQNAEGLTALRESLAIRERLAKGEPGNRDRQHDLSVIQQRVGDILAAQGARAEALASFQESLAIALRLSAADPNNAEWHRNLSTVHNKVGDMLAAQGNLAEALTHHRESLAIRARLAETDPNNAEWQRNLSVSYNKVGDTLEAQGNVAEALKYFRDSLAIAERLAKADPSNAQWQWDLVVAHWRLATRGDEAARRWAFIVAEMRRLKDENRLRPAWARFLPTAEQELAKLQGARAPR